LKLNVTLAAARPQVDAGGVGRGGLRAFLRADRGPGERLGRGGARRPGTASRFALRHGQRCITVSAA
jgi:hypothetical protein